MYYAASNGIKTVVITPDPDPINPRDPDYMDNVTKMVCWHGRYRLGDDHDFKTPHDFAADMVNSHVRPEAVFTAMKNGELPCFRLTEKEGAYAVEALVGLVPGKETWEPMDWKVSKDMEVIEGEASFDMEEDILDYCSAEEMLQLCAKHGDVAILPLYLYDHSGISISTGSFVGRAHHAEWDSGQVGYIYLDKKTAMEELAIPSDTIHLAKSISSDDPIKISRNPADNIDDVMAKNGYTLVRAGDIKNIDAMREEHSNQPIIMPQWAEQELLYKKDRTLYVFSNFNPDNTFDIYPVATFNPDLERLTDANWKARAEEVMDADVKTYDNYLTGEVYGVQCFEGLEETDSCWGYNPGSQEIEELVNSEYSSWFGKKMDFEQVFYEDFDIEDFFSEREFPELKERIEEDVKNFITFEAETSQVYPFGMSAEDLLQNADSVLDGIVEDLYEEHTEYDTDRIFEAVAGRAGYSREVQPKLRAADLDPDRDYTADEIMEVMNKKPSLNDIIAKASAKRDAQQISQPGKGMDQVR